MRLSSPIYKLKRQARLMAREKQIKLHLALDQIATTEGFQNWGHLAAHYAQMTPAQHVLMQLDAGDMVLIGARPGQGKTLLGLELSAVPAKHNQTGCFFTLDYTAEDVREQLLALGIDPSALGQHHIVDVSDNISAPYIIARLGRLPKVTLAVVDYLQLLDQKRSNAPLETQVRALHAFAKKTGIIIAMIAQIDRAFEQSPDRFPSIQDVRLPNPLDLSLFDKRCFLHAGDIQIERAA